MLQLDIISVSCRGFDVIITSIDDWAVLVTQIGLETSWDSEVMAKICQSGAFSSV